MIEEIRQDSVTILSSEDTCTIPVIFRNLTGKNYQGVDYIQYIRHIAISEMGFTPGKIELFRDNKLIDTGNITFK